MRLIFVICFLLIQLLNLSLPVDGRAIGLSEAKITMQVVGEDGTPIQDAEVGFAFETRGTKKTSVKGVSDGDGLFSVKNGTSSGYTIYSAKKSSYYRSGGNYSFHRKKNSRKWYPQNPTLKVVLRKIENPVPMYVRDTQLAERKFPVTGKETGFDLIEYDWLPPYGKGKKADLIFKFDTRYTARNDFESSLVIKFSNEFDGIQLHKEDRKGGSVFKLPRYAPENGYQPELERKIKGVPGKPIKFGFEDDNNYFFRVRSEVEDGKLIRAMYGKIQGDIKFYPNGVIDFFYFLNPDYSRNMEFGGNLFKNLNNSGDTILN